MTAPRCLIVLAHPLRQSLAAGLATVAVEEARAAGWTVTLRDLYADGFDPNLSQTERAAYYTTPPDTLTAEKAELASTEILILVFPTWWSGFPAILKGWFDRVWAPGTAFDHGPGFGPMLPRLTALRQVLAVTTQGAPAWVDWLVLTARCAAPCVWPSSGPAPPRPVSGGASSTGPRPPRPVSSPGSKLTFSLKSRRWHGD